MEKRVVPKCRFGQHSYFSAEGRWLPCCSFPAMGKEFKESIFSRDEYLLKNNERVDEFHDKDSFLNWIEHIETSYESNLEVCKNRCSLQAHETMKNRRGMRWTMEELEEHES
jgi:hypothetical protein